jgi:predicted HAD superfamily Cof-like phosphohydrolase
MPLHESTGLLHLRRKLIHEEAQETCEALYQYMKLLYTDQDELQKDAEQATRKEVLDGLCDVLVVAIGTALALGLDIEEAMERVHTSNMSKLGADGRPIYRKDGKIMKGPDYKEPDFDDLV